MDVETPPEEENIPDRRRASLFIWDAVDAASLNAHLRIQPFLPLPQFMKNRILMLQLFRDDDLFRRRDIIVRHGAGAGFDVVLFVRHGGGGDGGTYI